MAIQLVPFQKRSLLPPRSSVFFQGADFSSVEEEFANSQRSPGVEWNILFQQPELRPHPSSQVSLNS